MRCLSVREANAYLSGLKMTINQWNRIDYLFKTNEKNIGAINYRAPKSARELHCFAQYVAGWLPKGKWKLLQIDDSSVFDVDEAALLGKMLLGSEETRNIDIINHRAYLAEFGSNRIVNENIELLLASVIAAFLLFEQHAYLTSEGSENGQVLGLQDGFVYFSSFDKDVSGATRILKEFETNPSSMPQWVVDISNQ